MSHSSKTTTNHDEIRKWVEARGRKPASVKATKDGDDPDLLCIDMPGYAGADSLETVEWDDWFETFEEQKLAFLYQEETKDGEKSNFNKLVSRD